MRSLCGGWVGCGVYVVVYRYIIMPLRGPTCKIARFQAELKFPSWTECGNIVIKMNYHKIENMFYSGQIMKYHKRNNLFNLMGGKPPFSIMTSWS